jgi:hypothetical protein
MNSCVGTNGQAVQKICGCVLEKMEARYTVEQVSRMEVDLDLGKPLPDEVLDMLASCRVSAR